MSTKNYTPYIRSYKENVERVVEVMKRNRVFALRAITCVSMPRRHYSRMMGCLTGDHWAEKRPSVVRDMLMEGYGWEQKVADWIVLKLSRKGRRLI